MDTIQWSVLPPTPLLGLGEESVESLDHYMLRSAASSGVSQARLRSLCLSVSGTPLSRSASAIAFFPTMEQLTGNALLRHGTLWSLSGVLHARPVARAGNSRRWCPLCYAGWIEGESREMLIFELELCLICPTHQCALAANCPACAAPQGATTPYWKRHKCAACGAHLGTGVVYPRLSPFEAWIQIQLEALVRFCASPEQSPVPSDNLRIYISLLVAQAGGAPRAHLLKKLSRHRNHKRDDGRRSLQTLLNACAFQGVSVIDALTQPREAASMPLLDLWDTYGLLPLEAYKESVKPHRGQWLLSRLLCFPTGVFLPSPAIALGLLNVECRDMELRGRVVYRKYVKRYDSQGDRETLQRLSLAFSKILCLQTARRRLGKRLSRRFERSELADDGVTVSAARRVSEAAILIRRLVAQCPKEGGLDSDEYWHQADR
jgi:TniQ